MYHLPLDYIMSLLFAGDTRDGVAVIVVSLKLSSAVFVTVF